MNKLHETLTASQQETKSAKHGHQQLLSAHASMEASFVRKKLLTEEFLSQELLTTQPLSWPHLFVDIACSVCMCVLVSLCPEFTYLWTLLCVCVCVCVYVCVHVYGVVGCVCVCVCVRVHVYGVVGCVHAHVYVCVHVCVGARMRVCMCVCTNWTLPPTNIRY